MRKPLRFVLTLPAAGLLLFFASCGKEPRTSDDIFQDQMQLPTVYFTAETNTRVIAPQGNSLFVDETTGELAWPAMACHNPDCPGRGPDGEMHLFICPQPGYYAEPDGSVGYDPSRASTTAVKTAGLCPECLKGRNPNRLTQDERQQFINWVRPYVLPETAARIHELDAERKRISDEERPGEG